MFNTYLKAAWRSLWKNKVFSFINVVGLTIGLTSFLIIALYIFNELTFDRQHAEADHIYRIVENKTLPDGKLKRTTGAGYQVSEKGKQILPEIRAAGRLAIFGRVNVASGSNPANVFYEDFIMANQGFLSVFSFPLLSGDRYRALTEPNSIVVTEESALKYLAQPML